MASSTGMAMSPAPGPARRRPPGRRRRGVGEVVVAELLGVGAKWWYRAAVLVRERRKRVRAERGRGSASGRQGDAPTRPLPVRRELWAAVGQGRGVKKTLSPLEVKGGSLAAWPCGPLRRHDRNATVQVASD
jgi:hypothetical protein